LERRPHIVATRLRRQRISEQSQMEKKTITAFQPGPFSSGDIQDGRIAFEGPHYPKPHTYYGQATVENGKVTKVQ